MAERISAFLLIDSSFNFYDHFIHGEFNDEIARTMITVCAIFFWIVSLRMLYLGPTLALDKGFTAVMIGIAMMCTRWTLQYFFNYAEIPVISSINWIFTGGAIIYTSAALATESFGRSRPKEERIP